HPPPSRPKPPKESPLPPAAKTPAPKKPQRPRRKRSLALACALAAVPIAALSALTYLATNQAVTKSQASTQQAQAAQLAERLSQFLGERQRDVRSLAELPLLRDAKLRKITNDFEKLRELEQQKASMGLYEGVAVFDLAGNSLHQTAGSNWENPKDQPFFQRILQTDRPNLSLVKSTDEDPWIHFAAPVLDSITGKPVAVVMARMSLEKAESILHQGSRGGDQFYVFDRTGQVLIAKQRSQTKQAISQLFPGAKAPTNEQPTQLVSAPLSMGLSLWQGKPDLQKQHLIGISNAPTVSGMVNLGWTVASAADPQAVVSEQRSRVTLLGLSTIGITVLVGGILGLLAKRTKALIKGQVEDLKVQNTSLQRQQRHSTEQSRMLGRVVQIMRQSQSEDTLLQATVTELRYILQADRVVFYRFNEDWTGVTESESVASGWKSLLGESMNHLFYEKLIDRYRHGHVQVINSLNEGLAGWQQAILAGMSIQACVFTPIVQEGKLKGLLCAHQCDKPRTWEAGEVDLLSKVSEQLGLILEQIAQLKRQDNTVRQSHLLNEILGNMRRSLNPDDILSVTVSELRHALNTDRILVYSFKDDWNGIVLAESAALGYPKLLGQVMRDQLRSGLIDRYRHGNVRVINDMLATNLTEHHHELLDGYQVRASMIAPILQDGQLTGLLCAHECKGPRQWVSEDVDLFKKLSMQLGFALEQATVFRRQLRNASQAKLMNNIVGTLRRATTRIGVFDIAVNELRHALQTNRVIIYQFDDWSGRVVSESVSGGWRKLINESVPSAIADGAMLRYRSGQVHVVNDVNLEDTDWQPDILMGFQVQASLTAPILDNGELIGMLCAHECSGVREWEGEEVDLISQVAVQISFALEQVAILEFTERARQAAHEEASARDDEYRRQREHLQMRTKELLEEVSPITRGDLTVRARVTSDEVGVIAASYNSILESLRNVIGQMQESSRNVADTALGSEFSVSALSQEAKRQTQAVQMALGKIQAMVDSIQGVYQRAKRAEMSVQMATKTLAAGDEAMDRTVHGMSDIRETVAETAKKVKRLGEASQKISRVVSLINTLATQTNLLAMNASIEAAKAGEEGQGFVIVAEEVRTLAQQSAAATAEIEQVVEEIQRQTNEVVTAMETGTEQVVTGTQLVEESRQHLSQINEVGNQLQQLVREISQAAAVQTETSTAVSQTIRQVADMANETSRQTETVAGSFAELLKVAHDLQESAAQFKVR
ncbi:MAG: GAF domain-containing protein, partial [Alkalinema sp. RU_4_3]|nr:GAF domain-containing protein [Alkalinema sp. RU_4_3]